MLRYETVNAAQVARWRLPGNGPGLVNAQGVFIPDVEGGGGGAVGSTWLLGQKVVGDQHVPQGEVSFRVKLREADGRPALIQCAPTAGVRAAWAGEGCLARPGIPRRELCARRVSGAHRRPSVVPLGGQRQPGRGEVSEGRDLVRTNANCDLCALV